MRWVRFNSFACRKGFSNHFRCRYVGYAPGQRAVEGAGPYKGGKRTVAHCRGRRPRRPENVGYAPGWRAIRESTAKASPVQGDAPHVYAGYAEALSL